ncbi:hypothetical protein LTR91_011990 [Friedmanniomyces endolithicus]|uniref:HCP-like protein n=1 Tax=Friedmanniomyces endolithicus TaxID=329885 RepID=A0AAN6KGI4_9PEZI|nr:hypothetical protein LTR57_014190 [Friedmanniomyces endolithicus]KAK0981134.1 hypothetical protein LTR91_011990 [Friedmanniomyces endolithicus]KAK1035153.1 hypothetical protein LTS16_014857 [Friedmanniomyces endolithicus]
MAYNANAPYQPPQRSYYGQTQQQQQAQQQQAPVQQVHGHPASGPYEDPRYDQGYSQSYGQDYNGQQPQEQQLYSSGYGNGDGQQHAAISQQQEGYSDGYHGGYQKQKARPINGDVLTQQRRSPGPQQMQQQPQQEQQYERNYDPRYQQRPGRGTPPAQSQQSVPRPQQQQQQYSQAPIQPSQPYQHQEPQHVPRERQAPPEPRIRTAVDPRNANPQPSPQHRQRPVVPPPNQYPLSQQQPPRQQPAPRAAAPQKSIPIPPTKSAAPPKQTMEEWKAAEKARLHKDSASLSFMPQDNAFPTFPTTRPVQKKERLHPDERAGTAMSGRSSSDVQRGQGQARGSVGSVGSGGPQQLQQQRPGYDRHPSPGQGVQQQQPHAAVDERQGQRPLYDRQPSSGQRVPQQQRPVQNGAPPLRAEQRSPATAGGYGQPPPPAGQDQYGSAQGYGQPVPNNNTIREEQRSPVQTRGYQHPPISIAGQDLYAPGYGQQMPNGLPPGQDLSQAREYPQSPPPPPNDGHEKGYGQQSQPLPQQAHRGPADGGRPPFSNIDTSAQARRPPASNYMDHQPLSPACIPPRPSTAHSQFRTPSTALQVAVPGRPDGSALSYQMTPTGYMGGGEAAAPQQRSGNDNGTLAGRDAYDRSLDEPVPQSAGPFRSTRDIESEMPDFDSAAPGGTSLLHKRGHAPNPDQRTEQQQRGPSAVAAGVYELSAPAQHQHQPAPERGYYDAEYGQEPDSGFGTQHAPPQPPFASEPVVRKSMDDARQMPYQGGPSPAHFQPPQRVRMPPNEQPPNGQYPPPQQQRPAVDERNFSDQTMQSVRSQPPRGVVYTGGLPQRPGPEGRNMSGQTVQSVRSEPPRGAVHPPPQRPGMDDRNMSGHTMQTPWADPRLRVLSAPPLRQGFPKPPGQPPMNGTPMSPLSPQRSAPEYDRQGLQEPPGRPSNGVPLSQQRSAPEYDQQHRVNPDALPHHPVPARPGLMEGGMVQQTSKPPPVRQYDIAPASAHTRQASVERPAQPVTLQELDHLRAAVAANPTNHKQALTLAKKLVEASNILASEGGRADPRTTAKNREKYILEAHKRIKKAASAGYQDAQFYLADCYGQGLLGLEVDTKEAFNMYQAAAKQGHPQAAYRTAVCCEMGPEEGGGTRKDYAKAVQWYRRAAALGDIPAMYKLGIILLKGLLGQPRSVSESVTWLKRAAERADKDNPHALHELGTLYESSNTNPDVRAKLLADDAYARELYLQAAALNYKFSQFRLGQAYEYGSLGVGIDHRASISWYSKAAAQGEHQAELALSGWWTRSSGAALYILACPYSTQDNWLLSSEAALLSEDRWLGRRQLHVAYIQHVKSVNSEPVQSTAIAPSPDLLSEEDLAEHVYRVFSIGEPSKSVLRIPGFPYDAIERFLVAELVGIIKGVEGRIIFTTAGGLLGLSCWGCYVRDEVWLLPGASVPFVLKPQLNLRSKATPVTHQLIGDAFVHGIMYGEAMAGYEARVQRHGEQRAARSLMRCCLV